MKNNSPIDSSNNNDSDNGSTYKSSNNNSYLFGKCERKRQKVH